MESKHFRKSHVSLTFAAVCVYKSVTHVECGGLVVTVVVTWASRFIPAKKQLPRASHGRDVEP